MSDQLEPKTCGIFEGPRNSAIVTTIESRGDTVVRFPRPNHHPAELSRTDLEAALDGCEVLALTDVLAAEEFVARLAEFEIDPAVLDGITVCALGEAVADRLRFIQVHADIIPARTAASVVFDAITNYFGGLDGMKIVVASETDRESELSRLLKAKGADLFTLGLYQIEPMPGGTARLAALLAGGGIDEFIICEPIDVLMLERLAGDAPLTELLRDAAVFGYSEVEFCSLQEAGLRPLYFRR